MTTFLQLVTIAILAALLIAWAALTLVFPILFGN